MTVALDGGQRTALSNLIQKARSLLKADLASTLEGDFGIHRSDGRIEETDALSLDASQLRVRIDLLDIVAFLRSEGETEPAAVERLIREAAFTHVNRLVALRVAEGLGILPEVIGNGLASQGFRDFAEIAPASAGEDWERFRLFVRICADELSADVPALFDPRNPLLELEPSTAAFSELIKLFGAAEEAIWSAPDALGWSYQFFNSAEERREMRESSAPRNSRELAVRNQFFTPSYVVDFLVHNGLGAHLAASYPALAEDLPLLLELPQPLEEPVDLRGVSALDPACGSGHFLLGAYDVLEAAWQHTGVEPDDAAPHIVRSLWGVDIDPRATQIAQAAVILRARRHCRAPLPKPNVICARSLPAGPETDDLIASLPSHVGRVVRAIADELVMAPVLGPLLKIEERLDREARDAFGTGQIEGTLSEAVPEDGAANVESLVLETLSAIADQTTSTASQRLFAAEAHDAVRFVEAMNRRYTTCMMNPPFGEPVASTKEYLKNQYPWLPKIRDLLAAFVGRGLELCESGGRCSAITSRAGFFLASYEAWRSDVLLTHQLEAVADLGHGVMEDALVEAAAYVLRNQPSRRPSRFVRLLRERDRPASLSFVVGAARSSEMDHRLFEVNPDEFSVVPGAPLAYWLGDSVRSLFRDLPSVESGGTRVHKGTSTSDDFQFVRLRWEVDPNRIGRSADESRQGLRWCAFAKGGEYSPFWLDLRLLVDWQNGGQRIKETVAAKYPYLNGNVDWVIGQEQEFFKEGVTWSARTASAFSPRVLPAGAVFGHKGNKVSTNDVFGLLGWLNTRLISAVIAGLLAAGDETTSGGASKSYEIGVVRNLPLVEAPEAVRAEAREIAALFAVLDQADETSSRFVGFVRPGAWRAQQIRRRLEIIERSLLIETEFESSLRLGDEGNRFTIDEVGLHPARYSRSTQHDEEIAVLYKMPMKSLIDELLDRRGGHRAIASLSFVGDRRLEVIAHGLEVAPASVAAVAQKRSLAPPGEVENEEFRYLSYLVGLAFGRWDVGSDRSVLDHVPPPDTLLDPVPAFPPARLLDEDGQPPSSTPGGYPLLVPGDGVLLDHPGHELDLAERVHRAFLALEDDNDSLDSIVGTLLKQSDVRSYLRKQFFKQHLAMYSLSRRKAPIYWQLQVPSKTWGVWLYMPRLCREMVFAIVRETEQRQRLAEQRIATLHREYNGGGAGRAIAVVSKELDAEQKLAVELVAFGDEAERIANLGWEPDLDDGAVLNAAPLASLFPAWKDAGMYLKELKQGKHTWSTVSKYADQL